VRVGGLNQDITYWAPAAENQFGVKSHLAPILIKGRWEDKNEEFTVPGGETITSRAVVMAERALLIDGFLAKGDHTSQAEPTAVAEAEEIRHFESSPDLRSVTSVNKAVL